MKQYIFMTEESSMEEFLNVFLPLHFPHMIPNVNFRVIPHEGKSDLEKSIPRKLKGFPVYEGVEYHFVIIRDQDAGDCKVIKQKLQELCNRAGKPDTLIRIACKELESWFLGELGAIERAFGIKGIAKLQGKKKYKNPDNMVNPSKEVANLCRTYGKKNYSKTMGARDIASEINPKNNCSKSFNAFFTGLKHYISNNKDEVTIT